MLNCCQKSTSESGIDDYNLREDRSNSNGEQKSPLPAFENSMRERKTYSWINEEGSLANISESAFFGDLKNMFFYLKSKLEF